ncbi:hypothetical protein NNO07_27915, partial [Pseudomonas resinovorans]|nr:hypothetical protein [Pseudomonas resinovorans]
MKSPTRVHHKSSSDVRDPVSPCPARQADIFVVPVRYALAEQAARHPGVEPSANAASHPMALRQLRSGFLYLWQGNGPLKRYAVAENGLLEEQPLAANDTMLMAGSIAGLRLDKRQEAWLLYSEIPLGTQAREQLDDPAERQKYMRHIAMAEIAQNLQAAHCPPLDEADNLLAELMPEVRDLALAQDYLQNHKALTQTTKVLADTFVKDPSPGNVRSYVQAMEWLRAGEEAASRHPDVSQPRPGHWSAVPWDIPRTSSWVDKAREQAGELFPVFAVLDDDLGVLRDLNHEQEQVEAMHEEWVADNNLRQSVGGFIRGL